MAALARASSLSAFSASDLVDAVHAFNRRVTVRMERIIGESCGAAGWLGLCGDWGAPEELKSRIEKVAKLRRTARTRIPGGSDQTVQRDDTRNFLIGPAHQNAAGGVARAYGDKQDQVAFFQAPLGYGVAQPQRDGACGGVAVAIDIHHYFRILDAQALLHGADDAQVGLMRDDQGEIVALYAVAFEQIHG